MTRYLLDTDHLTLFAQNHPRVVQNILRHAADDVFICVITIHEQFLGWHNAIIATRDPQRKADAYFRMAQLSAEIAQWQVHPFTVDAMIEFESLLRQRLNVSGNDLRIAAIALKQAAIVVTRNSRDFSRIPGLNWVDWSI